LASDVSPIDQRLHRLLQFINLFLLFNYNSLLILHGLYEGNNELRIGEAVMVIIISWLFQSAE
jgi:hypothetical protein